MVVARHITWENFVASYLTPGDPAVHLVAGRPTCELFVDSGATRMGIRIALSHQLAEIPDNFAYLVVRQVLIYSQPFLEIATIQTENFEASYALFTSIADRVQLSGLDAFTAVEEAVEDFKRLLQPLFLLTEDQMAGLWGELWLLNRLLKNKGVAALDMWVGPHKDSHDFRLGTVELEVKTSRGTGHIHMINGAGQLQPSPARQLYLLSLQVAAGGTGGISLAAVVQSIQGVLPDERSKKRFFELLALVGFRLEESHFYRSRFELRSKPRIIAIDATIPRITSDSLHALWGSSASRITDIHYRLSVDGLGNEEGSPEFAAIVP